MGGSSPTKPTLNRESGIPVADTPTSHQHVPPRRGSRPVPGNAPAAIVQVAPRLLDLESAARYLGGISVWTVRDLIANGTLRRVMIPLPNGRDLRRALLDREDLDALIAKWKAPV